MNRQITIRAGSVSGVAALNNTKTAEAVWQALPLTGRVNTWGEEIYFKIPVIVDLESGQEVVNSGDLGYWPPGHAFCIFFGLTPASRGDEIRAARAVTVFGKLRDDPTVFKKVRDGEKVVVEGCEAVPNVLLGNRGI